ncbi:MAG TPA: fumarylacetoacetate hydrolase family protein [Chitinophagaceae bacterium]|nr:MAG: fumarylacetoacetate (FAA) hydrolase [Bacteroidetes bacterium OLB11]HMN32851.1 fumarylacetoacetate hydrolase family protein [Chitinophagaceae bacterium]
MKIICIGRNYINHVQELKNDIPEKPVLFLKPATALLTQNADFYYPNFTQDLHYECEIVLRICKNGKAIQEKFASTYYDAISVGIDFTARDLQNYQKSKGLPWEIAKSFDNSAVVGRWKPISENEKNNPIQFNLKLNNHIVQQGNTQDMIHSFDKIIQYASQFFSLQVGDILFTGTPAGVGAIKIGDCLVGSIVDEELLRFYVK